MSVWDSSAICGLWRAYEHFVQSVSLLHYLLIMLAATVVVIVVGAWANNGDAKARQKEEETWRSTSSS